MATRARDRLLQAARDLFYAEGIRAVGVERLLDRSGVGRASFYRHFDSKDALVVAMLRGYDEEYRAWLQARVAELGGEPLVLFDALAERAEQSGFRGCAFLNAMAEVSDPDSAVHRMGVEHKRAVTAYVAALLDEAGYADHDALARQLMVLMDGATVTAHYERTTDAARRARAAAAATLAAAAR
ncbi:TetR/AcrR family transcriptional regulator [Conexibacter woesei]|uniref:Transcriptional regulator, TetR family n=1 Tax=Conexibacter woesei (strain DSM 14684 / CCUG 47730 / CIP 108061 / JCM 11494 / NBRC 100937 / ID131577) TaxID=469383 RepID=D3F782_CONWI|nr:TetR/AcrR family transcriptional regulator [Conexibacter woesei]ADB48853.1 transcriptional regulator, TetR family [Conexibacter woesei DSM 14684]